MVKTREYNRKTCYPHSTTLLSSQMPLYRLDGAIKSLFACSNPTQQPIQNQEDWESGFTHCIYYSTWLNISHVPVRPTAPQGRTDTQRSCSMSWVHSEIEHPRHRNTEGMNSTDPRRKKKIPFAATFWSSQWFSCFSRWSHCSIHHGLQTRPAQPVQREKTCLVWGQFQKNPWLYPGKCVSLRQLHALLTNGLACPECPSTDF